MSQLQDRAVDVGARNIRRVSAACCGVTSGFEAIHGLVVRVPFPLSESLSCVVRGVNERRE